MKENDTQNTETKNSAEFDPFAPKTPDPHTTQTYTPFAPQTSTPHTAQTPNPHTAQNTSPSSTAVMEAINPADAAAYAAAHAANVAAQNEDEEEKKKKKRPFFLRFLQGFFLLIFIACLVGLGFIAAQYIIQRMSNQDLADRVVLYEDANGGDLAKMTIDWDTLRAECPDIVAWITVPNTVINYPIVQGPDNDYYLHRSYDGSATWASTGGTIFLDSSNTNDFSDQNNILYGHHMIDGSMFAELASWGNQDAFNEHRTIYVLTPTMNYRLTTFSNVLTTGTDAIIQTKFSTAESFTEYVQDKMNRSVVEAPSFTHSWDNITESVPRAELIGKMFMLVTCEYSRNDGRACICAYVAEQAAPLNL